MKRMLLAVVVGLSGVAAAAISTAEFGSFTPGANDTDYQPTPNALLFTAANGMTSGVVCLTRGVGAGAETGAVGEYTKLGGKARCKTTTSLDVPGTGRQPTVWYPVTGKFSWRKHSGATVVSSAVRWGKHVSGADVIPCRTKSSTPTSAGWSLGHVTVGSDRVPKCYLAGSDGRGSSWPDFEVLIQRSLDGA